MSMQPAATDDLVTNERGEVYRVLSFPDSFFEATRRYTAEFFQNLEDKSTNDLNGISNGNGHAPKNQQGIVSEV